MTAFDTPTPSTPTPSTPPSPKWGSTTKLIVGLTIVAIVAALLIQFRMIIGPVILAFILAYVLHPVIERLSFAFKIPWRTAVSLVYLLLIIVLVGLITLTGLAVVQQVQSLYEFVRTYLTNLPKLVEDLSSQVYQIGPFQLNMAQFDLEYLANQVLAAVQPVLGRVGSIISTFATGAAVTFGWGLFALVISYFLLADTDRVSNELVRVDIPGYNTDVRRLTYELRKIWNAFLRGQLIIIILVIITYTILLTVLGMRFVLGIALLAGLGRFVPYLGPLVLWIVTGLVAFFQSENYFGLEPYQYALLVLAAAFLTDQVFDNLVTPRFLGQTLGVHPAAVLIAAIIAAGLIGLIGLILAAPSLATLVLIGRYVIRKMLDLDPFPEPEIEEDVPETRDELPWVRSKRRLMQWWREIQRR